MQENLVPPSLGSPDAVFVPFVSRAANFGITGPDSYEGIWHLFLSVASS